MLNKLEDEQQQQMEKLVEKQLAVRGGGAAAKDWVNRRHTSLPTPSSRFRYLSTNEAWISFQLYVSPDLRDLVDHPIRN